MVYRLTLAYLFTVFSCLEPAYAKEDVMSFQLSSPAFKQGEMMPVECTCDGSDRSPALAWTEPPPGTKSFALIADDPDAPAGTWVHWVVYNLPATVRQMKENFPTDKKLSDGTLQGRNDFAKMGYGGPCPPGGTHRYYFKLYALDTRLSLAPGATPSQLETAMKGHILAEAQLMGTYRRSR